MTLRNYISMRTLFLSLLLATPFTGVACLDPELKDAEIGCGVDAMVNAKCPNRPPVEAGPPSPDSSPDSGVAPDGDIESPDVPSAPTDTPPDQAVIPVTPDASLADRAIDGPGLTGLDSRPDNLLATPDASLADRAIDSPGLTSLDSRPDGLEGSDVTLD